MKTSSEHLLKLVVDLLDFHRLDLHKAEINRVTFHPARLLEEIHVSFEPLTSAKGLELHCNIASELEGTYISDPLRLRQIINNLLSNAVKFTDKGGVTMTACYENRSWLLPLPIRAKEWNLPTGNGFFRSLPACRCTGQGGVRPWALHCTYACAVA